MALNQNNKQLDFYYRAKKQYQNGAKPFTYEFNIFSTQPKPKKFMIIINKFIDIMKQGMKQQYSNQQELKQNYWNELEKYYNDTYQMSYILQNSYQKKKNKLRLFFGILFHNKKIFQFVNQLPSKLPFLYENPSKKIQQLNSLLEPVEFLKDCQYNIMSQFITQYQKYQEKIKQQQIIKQKLLEKERKKQQQLQQIKRKKQEQQKLERQKKQQQQRKIKQQNQKKLKFQQQKKLKQNQLETKNNINLPKLEEIQFIPESYKTHYANNQQKVNKKFQQSVTPQQNLVTIPAKNKKHMKNSEILYQQKFKDLFQIFSFKLKPDFQQTKQNKQKCFQCNQTLKQGFYLFGGNQNLCQYTGQYYCNQHIAQERIAIPWKAVKQFDLRGYNVSKKSYIQIKLNYEKPIIQIKNDQPIIKNNKLLYEFLILKRQIHLMYDSICDLELMEPLMKKKLNYCVKSNLFSLKNLYDIYNGHQIPSLQREYDILSKHFYRCQTCQKRKGYICQKCKDPVKIFAFQLKQTHGCTNCRKMYHRKCLVNNKCDCLDED